MAFSQNSNLKSHIKKYHEASDTLKKQSETFHKSLKYKCGVCEKNLDSKSALNYHIEVVHEGLKKYKCDKCGKSFGLSGHLKDHIEAVHEGKKNFKCHICDRFFSQASNLRTHYKNHHKSLIHPSYYSTEKNPTKKQNEKSEETLNQNKGSVTLNCFFFVFFLFFV